MLPLKRIWLDEAGCTKDIPVPDWKQFVLGKTQTYSELEDRVRKMMFWYKDALIGNLHQRGRVVSKWNFVSNPILAILFAFFKSHPPIY